MKKIFIILAATLLFGSFSSTVKASHAAGADISYTYIGGNVYRVTYTFYRDCSGIAAPGNVTIVTSSTSCGVVPFNTVAPQTAGPVQVVPICGAASTTCTGGGTPGRQQYKYQANITLPSLCTDWVFGVSVNARNAAITTGPSGVLYVEATLNNTIVPGNNASTFANNPAAFIYTNQNFCFNNGAVDIDGDSLVYSLVTPKTGPLSTDTVTYNFPYTASQPLTSVPAVTLNSNTGDVCMTPTALEVTVMAVLVQEYRYGMLIGTEMRDIQITTLAGADNLPYDDGINSSNTYSDTAVVGCLYTFQTKTFDADALQNLTISSNVAAAIPAASFVSSGGSRPTGTFSWTPVAGDATNYPHFFTVTVRDDYCNIEGQQVKAYGIRVISLTADFTTTAPSCVGQGVNFYSKWTLSNYSYLWDFGAGSIATYAQATSSNPTGVTYTTSGAKTVTLSITTPAGCVVTKSNVITINPTPASTFTSTAPVCTNTAVSFTNTGATGIGTAHLWDFGAGANPQTSSVENPTGVSYSSSGSKTISHTVAYLGCSSTTTALITINATPVSSFTSTAPKCTGAAVDFTNTGTSAGVSFSWNFGSGAAPATSTLQNPTGVTYATAGTKIVTLTVTNSGTGCAVSSTQTININQTPASSFSNNAPVCVGTPVDFTNTGSSGFGISYSWDFGTGANPATSTAQNPSGITYSSSGSKTATQYITNQFGCVTSSTLAFTIDATPVAAFTSTAPQCTGAAVDFTNTGSSSGVLYDWDFGSGAVVPGGMTTSQDPSGITYTTAGIKSVVLTVTNSSTGCVSVITQTININQTPTASFSSNTPACAGSSVDFGNTGTSGSNWSYFWDLGQDANPPTSTSENPVGVMYSAGGTKTITFTISDQNCTSTSTSSVVINALPVANAGLDTTICANRSVAIGSASVSGMGYSWFPSNTLDNPAASAPTASPVAPVTTYYVTVTDVATGCQSMDSVRITMLAPLKANAGTDGEICLYDSIQVGAALIEGQTYSWSPVTGLADPSAPLTMASPSQTTAYTLTVMGANCTPVTDDVTIIVHPLPVADAGRPVTITAGSSTGLTATGGVQYEWIPVAGLDNSSVFNPVASPEVTTLYWVTVTDVYGCVNTDSVTVTVVEPSIWAPSAFTPDASGKNDVFYIRGRGINNFQLSVYNRWGEAIFSSKDMSQGWDGKKQVSGEDMPEGAYMYTVKGTQTNGKAVDMKGIINLIR